ncbi:MAG: hypothetical protein L0H75_01380 [Nitrosospira sp.]|nr:hypothetical protein [Nitrosospira sp.]
MSEEQLHKQSRQPVSKEPTGDLPVHGRRRLLKGTVAIPVIMTLHSGAVLARTSNLVGAINDTASAVKDKEGDLLCIHPGSGGSDPRINPVDLGEGAFADADKTQNADGTPDLEAQAVACQNAGGIMVSATAWSSIAPRVTMI